MTYGVSFLEAFRKNLMESNIEEEYYTTFEYTRTGFNSCHSRTLGEITKALWKMKETKEVYIDARLKNADVTFRPDILAYNDSGATIAIDFESPNSSDARIIEKDILQFLRWKRCSTNKNDSINYIILTSLPEKSNDWELRWTGKGYYNEGHKVHQKEIIDNPYVYWFTFYKKELEKVKEEYKEEINQIVIANLKGKKLEKEDLW